MASSIVDFIEKASQNEGICVNQGFFNNLNFTIVYMIDSVDIKKFDYQVKPYLNQDNVKKLEKLFLGMAKRISDISISNLEYLLYSSKILLFFDEDYYAFEFTNKAKRSINSSIIDPEDSMASQDALIEDLNVNLTLIKRRLKSNNLCVKKYQLGLISKTDCAVLYLKNFHDKVSLNNIISKLESIKSDTITSINDLNIIYDNKSLLPQVFSTSSPEIIVDAIMKGRIVLLLDNAQVASVLPANLSLFTASKSYVNTPKYFAIFNHILVFIFFFISLFMMGLFIAIINFHPSVLSIPIFANIKITERGTNWPMFFEVLIVYFLFEFYRFATSRSTNNSIQNIIVILGGLFIGQNAIESGTIGATVLFMTSISYIAVFAVTNNIYLITSINILRLFILILSYTLGILGFLVASLITIFYFYKQHDTSNYYLYPFIPFNKKDFVNYFVPKNDKMEVTK